MRSLLKKGGEADSVGFTAILSRINIFDYVQLVNKRRCCPHESRAVFFFFRNGVHPFYFSSRLNEWVLTRSLPRAILTFHHPIPPPQQLANNFGNVISDSDSEGRDGSFIVRRIRSAVPRDQKVTNSRHMMAPKSGFSRGLKAKARGAVTACVPGPLRRRSSKVLQACRPRLAQEATMGKVTIFFFYLQGSFKCMIVILPTFWHSAPAWDFSWQLTRNVSLATMLVHSYGRSLDEGYGKASVHCELKRRRLRSQQKCGHFPPRRPRH